MKEQFGGVDRGLDYLRWKKKRLVDVFQSEKVNWLTLEPLLYFAVLLRKKLMLVILNA